MKNNIRTILREEVEKNSLGVHVSNPSHILYIMSGVPGAGKSTKAKELADGSEIYSTDDRIEEAGDYREFFANMIKSGNFGPLGRMHQLNYEKACGAMDRGVNPIVIDNTNLSPSEPKKYVEYALSLGYADDNIVFVNVGTGGASAEELAERNTHGVPLDKIKIMIKRYNAHAPLTLEKVIKSKNMNEGKKKSSKIAFVKLDDASKKKLFTALGHKIPSGWDVHMHHMTINFGKGLDDSRREQLGNTVQLVATDIGVTDKVIAVKVIGFHSDNAIPHITLGVNPNGGSPVMSGKIVDWVKLDSHINLNGTVEETSPFKSPTTTKS